MMKYRTIELNSYSYRIVWQKQYKRVNDLKNKVHLTWVTSRRLAIAYVTLYDGMHFSLCSVPMDPMTISCSILVFYCCCLSLFVNGTSTNIENHERKKGKEKKHEIKSGKKQKQRSNWSLTGEYSKTFYLLIVKNCVYI